MTIKNTGKNISAESGDIVLNITNNELNKDNNQSNFANNLILTITQKDFIDDNNEVHYKTIEFPISELVRLAYLENGYYSKSQVDDIISLYYTTEQIRENYYSKTETDNKIKIHFDVRNSLPAIADAKTNYIYLIPTENDSQENLYEEYIFIESQNDFEMIGSTKIDLTPYLQIVDLNEKLLEATNFTDALEDIDTNIENISFLQTDVQYFYNKLGFDKDDSDYFTFAISNGAYWFLSNADYDYPRKKFFKVDKNVKSLGIEIKDGNINIWESDDREDMSIPSSYNEDYDYSDTINLDRIGALNKETNKWESFNIPYAWINVLSITDGIVTFANTPNVNESKVLTELDYNVLLQEIEDHVPIYDTELANTSNAVQNSAIYTKTNALDNSITALQNITNTNFKNALWDFVWGSSGFSAESDVTRGTTNLGSFIYTYLQNILNSLDNSIMNRVGNLINTHNTSSNAHNDIREAINDITAGDIDLTGYVKDDDSRLSDARAPTSHTHTQSQITDLSIPTKTSDLTNDSDYITSAEVSTTYATKDSVDNIVAGDIDLTGYVKDDDSRLSDARTPTSHTHTQSQITDLSIPTKISDLENDSDFLTEQDISGKANTSDLATVATTGSYNDLNDKPIIPSKTSELTNDSNFLTEHQDISITKQAIPESGMASTYIINKGGEPLSPKINIPKDFLVKSASLETVSTANTPVTGFAKGDKYIDFIINTKNNDDTDEHLYINVTDLIDIYTAGTGLTLLNGAFNVKYGTSNTTACVGDDSRLYNKRDPIVNEIQPESDLNDYKQAGFYFLNREILTDVENIPNISILNPHALLFVESTNDNYQLEVKQVFTYNNDVYVRFYHGNWSNWEKTYTTRNIIEVTTSKENLSNGIYLYYSIDAIATVTGNSVTLVNVSEEDDCTYTYFIDFMGSWNRLNDGVIDWGDGTSSIIPEDYYHDVCSSHNITHEYSDGNDTHNIIFKGVNYLGAFLFKNCENLIKIDIPESVTKIGPECFANCSNLTRINLPSSVNEVSGSFITSYIEELVLNWKTSNTIISFGEMIYDTNNIGKISIPFGTTSLYVAKNYPLNKLVERD